MPHLCENDLTVHRLDLFMLIRYSVVVARKDSRPKVKLKFGHLICEKSQRSAILD